MDKKPSDETLAAYLLGELDEQEAERVRQMLEADAGLKDRLEGLSQVHQMLTRAASDQAGLSEEAKGRFFAEAGRLAAAVREAGTPRRSTRRLRAIRRGRSRVGLWAGVAAAAAAVVLAVLVLHRPTGEKPVGTLADAQRDAGPAGIPESAEAEARRVEAAEAGPVPAVDTHVDRVRTPEGLGSVDLAEAIPQHGPGMVAGARQRRGEALEERRDAGERRETEADAPALAVTETTRPVGRIVDVEGGVYYRRASAGRTFRAAAGLHFEAGDAIETRTGTARVEMADGTPVHLNRKTSAVFEETRIDLDKGEVYCAIIDPGSRLEVVTVDGVVRHLGTRFAVSVTPSGTTVVVEEGKVLVSNERGKVEVGTGFQARVRKGRTPGAPSKVDTVRLLAWVREASRTPRLKGLLGCWRLDDGEGAVMLDASGKGNHGSVRGDAAVVAGAGGTGLQFDGTEACIVVPDSAGLRLSEAATFTWWGRFDDFLINGAGIVEKDNEADSEDGYYVFAYGQAGQIRLTTRKNGRPNDGNYDSPAFWLETDDKWHFYAVVWQNNTNGGARFYRDGILSRQLDTKDKPIGSPNDGPLLIGRSDYFKQTVRGALRNVSIYGRVLTAREIQYLYRAEMAAKRAR